MQLLCFHSLLNKVGLPEIRIHLEVYDYDNYDNYITVRERKVSAQIQY